MIAGVVRSAVKLLPIFDGLSANREFILNRRPTRESLTI